MIAFDTEGTGTDLWHGCLPFSFQFCSSNKFRGISQELPHLSHLEGQDLAWVEWEVNPFTREPQIIQEDLDNVIDLLSFDQIVGHNVKFDILAVDKVVEYANTRIGNTRDYRAFENAQDSLGQISSRGGSNRCIRKSSQIAETSRGITPGCQTIYRIQWSNIRDTQYRIEWVWGNIHDSLIDAHLWRNCWSFDKDDMRYMSLSLKDLREVLFLIPKTKQDNLRKATHQARRIVKSKGFNEWLLDSLQRGQNFGIDIDQDILISLATQNLEREVVLKSGKIYKNKSCFRIAGPLDPHWPAKERAPSEKTENVEGWWYYDTWLPAWIAKHAPQFLPSESYETRDRRLSNRSCPSTSETVIQNFRDDSSDFRGGNERGTRQTYEMSERYKRHSWSAVLIDYGLEDVESTLLLYQFLQYALEQEGLLELSQQRHRLLEITYQMEQEGVDLKDNIYQKIQEYKHKGERYESTARQLISQDRQLYRTREGVTSTRDSSDPICSISRAEADDVNLASTKQLQDILYNRFQLPILKRTKPSKSFPEGQPSTDQETLEKLKEYLTKQQVASNPHSAGISEQFITALLESKRASKVATDMAGFINWGVIDQCHTPVEVQRDLYERADISCREDSTDKLRFERKQEGNSRNRGMARTQAQVYDRLKVHGSINITGTRFTRQSINSPAMQIVDEEVRQIFGPRENREWLSLDYQSIEYFIWGIACGNKFIRECLESGEAPFRPIMEIVHGYFNKEDPKYKKCKNGIYSLLYKRPSELKRGSRALYYNDTVFGKQGAASQVIDRLPELVTFTEQLHQQQVLKNGYVLTLGGFPLRVPRDEPHKAQSAHTQGTAGQIIGDAMVVCWELLQKEKQNGNETVSVTNSEGSSGRISTGGSKVSAFNLRRGGRGIISGNDSGLQQIPSLILQIHDELIFEGPRGFHREWRQPLTDTMSSLSDKYGVPLRVNASLITNTWDKGKLL